jgi:MarR family transcriptional regulator, organic hydroperoxide resistance regulator
MNEMKTDPNVDPRNYEGFKLWRKANEWEKTVNNALKQFDVSYSELLMLISLTYLSSTQDEVTQIDLVNYSGVTPMSVSKTLVRLEKNQFISRSQAIDTRAKSIVLSKLGTKLLINTAPIMKETNDQFFNPPLNTK